VGGVTYAYEDYVGVGEKVGTALATRVGLGRALQLLGVDGALPASRNFDIVRNGQTIHVCLVKKDGQWYFTAWHTEQRWAPFYGSYDKPVDDIKVGQVPAHHEVK
jgi:hypothetical protein